MGDVIDDAAGGNAQDFEHLIGLALGRFENSQQEVIGRNLLVLELSREFLCAAEHGLQVFAVLAHRIFMSVSVSASCALVLAGSVAHRAFVR
jgi:hypothetical protein